MPRLQLVWLRGRVAQRVFLLFILSAILPVTLLAAVVYFQVSAVLTLQAQSQLRHVSKNYGLSLLTRLQSLQNDYMPRAIGAALPDDKILGITVTTADGTVLQQHGRSLDASDVHILLSRVDEQEKPHLTSLTQAATQARVFIMARLRDTSDPRLIIAELAPDHLWHSNNYLPVNTSIAIFDEVGNMIYGTQGLPTALENRLIAEANAFSAGQLEWITANQRLVAGFWELFLRSDFSNSGWIIVAYQDADYAFAALATFKRLFLLVIALSLLIVVLISVSQIRRQLVPLEQLQLATTRLANQEFNLVCINSGDEFETLGNAFNSMSTRLKQQIDSLKVMADIDRLILSTNDLSSVLELVLSHIPAIAICDNAGIGIINQDAAEAAQTYVDIYSAAGKSVRRACLHQADIQLLLDNPHGWRIDARDASPLRQAFIAENTHAACLLPIVIDELLAGVISLEYLQPSDDHRGDLSQVRELADRLAVALSAVKREEQLYLQAHFDSLTRLPNRYLLLDRLDQDMTRAARDQSQIAVLFLDLDRFKDVNDTMGHAAGDELLQLTSERLVWCIRKSDTVARLGGDEFTIILSGIAGANDARQVAEEILKVLSQPFHIRDHDVFVSASIGISLYPGGGTSAAELLKNADTAMYRAKALGRRCYLFFEDGMNEEILERAKLEHDLRQAVNNAALTLHYQPQIDIASGELVGVEALLRWQHPQRGWVSPAQFIGVAEEMGLIESIGEWVLRTACREFRHWEMRGHAIQTLAVNVSGRQFVQEGFVSTVRQIIDETGIDPTRLELEITESVMMGNEVNTIAILDQLHAMGVQLSIDDFGTGYSSLAYLKRFPIDILKIDRSFIRDLPQDEEASTIASSIIALAKALNMKVIAEGVETREQLRFLQDRQCDYVQGFLYSPAVPSEQLAEFCAEHRKVAAVSVR